MSAYFFDSSALVKSYATETGTAWVTVLLDPATLNPTRGLISNYPDRIWRVGAV